MDSAKKFISRAHQIRPCENCPYRKDAPRRLWAKEEFQDLLSGEASDLGTLYACHKFKEVPASERGLCAGWLLDQKKRGIPSIRLRLILMKDPSAVAAYQKVGDGGNQMFVSVKAMCRANSVRVLKKRNG